jgi:hypothetical protein
VGHLLRRPERLERGGVRHPGRGLSGCQVALGRVWTGDECQGDAGRVVGAGVAGSLEHHDRPELMGCEQGQKHRFW